MPLLAALDLSLPLRDPVAVFTVVLLVLLTAPLVARKGVPSSVVLLVAGVALGPHALGVLARDPTMVLLGTVGLLYIMFLAGLEIDLHGFVRHRRQSLAFGLLTFALPQAVGTAVGVLGFGMGWAAAVLLGSVFASHTLLAYPAAARLGLQRETAVTAAVGATILTDTLALLVLAVVASGARAGTGVDPASLVQVALPLVGFGALVLWGLPRVGAWFLRRVAQDATVEFVFVLAAMFVCALGVAALGVEPIIGAFLAGLAMNRLVPEGGPLINRIGFFGNALFIPFFLLATGMLVDLGAFAGGPDAGRSWAVAGTMVAVVVATKGAASWAMRPAFGYSADEARVAFGLTVPQAAATLAAVLVGVEVGLFDGAVLNGTIAMVMATCLVGPWVVERAGRRLAATADTRAEPDAARSRVLVSLSNPATVGPLVDLALAIREPGPTDPLVAVTVVGGSADREADVLRGERLLSDAVVHAAGAAVPVLPLVRSGANVARALARAATETRATTLVLGWDGGAAAERLLFGSIPDRVLRETTASVLIARTARPLGTVGRFVVVVPPLAASEAGFEAAARLLAGLAGRTGAGIALLTPISHRDAVEASFARAAPVGPPRETLDLAVWKDVPAALDARTHPSDALVLVSARQGSVAWRASLDRLPHALAGRFPALPLFVLYPGQPAASATLSAGLTQEEWGFLDRFGPDQVRLDLSPGSRPRLLSQILGGLPAASDREAAHQALLEAPNAWHEIRPGVMLAHVHTAGTGGPLFTVGVSREGLKVDGAAGAVFVVAVLAVPARASSGAYLRWLALVARMLRADATLEALRSAGTPDAAWAALVSASQPPSPADEPGEAEARG